MPRARHRGVEIEYEVRGDEGARPLLLVMGLGCQMVHWEDGFCDLLVEAGHRVVRFDNRDTGRSTWFTEAGTPDLAEVMMRTAAGEPVDVPYRLDDMADDAIAVLEDLGLASAHVVGTSLGGMIAQCAALRHRDRVRTLTSIMSTTGRPGLPLGESEAMARLMLPAPDDLDALEDHNLETTRMLRGEGFALDEAMSRARTRRAFGRGHNPSGSGRQVAAIAASPPRHESLAALEIPALVIHGDADPLVHPGCGVDTHESLPDSELLMIEGLGHELPAGVWPMLVEAVSKLTARAEEDASAV